MARIAVCVALALAACTPTQSPTARRTGMVMSLGGVAGLTASAAATGVADTKDLVVGFSVISGVGIITYAVGELSDPPKGPRRETEPQKLRRWARILTERAAGAARENKCPRVRRLERRVNLYDREVHDFVFMKDPEIMKCIAPATGQPPAEEGLHLADPSLSPVPGTNAVHAPADATRDDAAPAPAPTNDDARPRREGTAPAEETPPPPPILPPPPKD